MRVELYTREGCCLCVSAKEVIERVRAELPFELDEIDVDGDAQLAARFGHEVPVVFVGGRKAFKYHVDEQVLRRKIQTARATARDEQE